MFGTGNIRNHFWKGLISLVALNALLYGRTEILSKKAYEVEFKGDKQKVLTKARRKALGAAGRPKSPFPTPSQIQGIHP